MRAMAITLALEERMHVLRRLCRLVLVIEALVRVALEHQFLPRLVVLVGRRIGLEPESYVRRIGRENAVEERFHRLLHRGRGSRCSARVCDRGDGGL